MHTWLPILCALAFFVVCCAIVWFWLHDSGIHSWECAGKVCDGARTADSMTWCGCQCHLKVLP